MSEPPAYAGDSLTHAISLVPFLSNFSRLPTSRGAPSGVPPSLESGCKDTNIFQSAKYFFYFFSHGAHNNLCHRDKIIELFLWATQKRPAKRAPRTRISAKLGVSTHSKNAVFAQRYANQWINIFHSNPASPVPPTFIPHLYYIYTIFILYLYYSSIV